jgi:hypothetical protein
VLEIERKINKKSRPSTTEQRKKEKNGCGAYLMRSTAVQDVQPSPAHANPRRSARSCCLMNPPRRPAWLAHPRMGMRLTHAHTGRSRRNLVLGIPPVGMHSPHRWGRRPTTTAGRARWAPRLPCGEVVGRPHSSSRGSRARTASSSCTPSAARRKARWSPLPSAASSCAGSSPQHYSRWTPGAAPMCRPGPQLASGGLI